jgi:hypothetical protein
MVCCGRSAVEVSGDVNGILSKVTFEANDGVECPVADGDAGRMVECLPQPVSLFNPMFVGLCCSSLTNKHLYPRMQNSAPSSPEADAKSIRPRARRQVLEPWWKPDGGALMPT